MASADHRNAGLREHVDVSAHVKDQGWIVNFLQACRIGGIVKRNDRHSGRAGFAQFFLG